MLNYSKGKPLGNNGAPQFDSPAAYPALRQLVSENGTVSSFIGFGHDSTAIEVSPVGGAAIFKWVSQGDTQASVVGVAGATANFDHVVPQNTVRRFVIPVETMPATGYSSMQGANRLNGLYQRIAFKTQGVASVFVSEY